MLGSGSPSLWNAGLISQLFMPWSCRGTSSMRQLGCALRLSSSLDLSRGRAGQARTSDERHGRSCLHFLHSHSSWLSVALWLNWHTCGQISKCTHILAGGCETHAGHFTNTSSVCWLENCCQPHGSNLQTNSTLRGLVTPDSTAGHQSVQVHAHSPNTSTCITQAQDDLQG